MKRRLKVTITKIQRKSVVGKTTDNRIFCPICDEKVETLSLNETIKILLITIESFNQLVESEKLHLVLMKKDDLRVCQNSLWQNNFEMFLPFRH